MLTMLVKKYHESGFLHLDLKPENIFIIPEKDEYMLLFDFHSLIKINDTEKLKTINSSFFDGFTAPELIQRNRKKIKPATDIFSIGAILYSKIFGRGPNALECSFGIEYDFTRLKYNDKNNDRKYPPIFYQTLTNFFHHTISSSTIYRYHNIETVITELKHLLELSDCS